MSQGLMWLLADSTYLMTEAGDSFALMSDSETTVVLTKTDDNELHMPVADVVRLGQTGVLVRTAAGLEIEFNEVLLPVGCEADWDLEAWAAEPIMEDEE